MTTAHMTDGGGHMLPASGIQKRVLYFLTPDTQGVLMMKDEKEDDLVNAEKKLSSNAAKRWKMVPSRRVIEESATD
jgi:hypothetical protein